VHSGDSFVREELHRPFTPPSTRVLINNNDEQQTSYNLIGETNDLPANLAQSIFQRENRPVRRDFVAYPAGSASSGKFDNRYDL
jgi:hypothetical protein